MRIYAQRCNKSFVFSNCRGEGSCSLSDIGLGTTASRSVLDFRHASKSFHIHRSDGRTLSACIRIRHRQCYIAARRCRSPHLHQPRRRLACHCRSLRQRLRRFPHEGQARRLLSQREARLKPEAGGIRFLQVGNAESSRRLEFAARLALLLRRHNLVREGFSVPAQAEHAHLSPYRCCELRLDALGEWQEGLRPRGRIHRVRL